MTNRNPVKQLFITFPHSKIDKQTFRDALLEFSPDYYKVVEEKHKDGTPHLHAIIRFKNKYSVAHVLKKMKEKYPDDYKRIDVKPVRSIKNALKYLSKEDQNPLESGEFTDTRNPKQNFYTKCARDFGFETLELLLEQAKLDKAYIDKNSQIIMDHLYSTGRMYNMGIEEYFNNVVRPQIEFCDTKRFYKLFSEKRILKDDITKILQILGLDY